MSGMLSGLNQQELSDGFRLYGFASFGTNRPPSLAVGGGIRGREPMNYEELTQEQKAKARACASADELVALAKQEGIDLSDEQLQAISGGSGWLSSCSTDSCSSNCGSYT